MGSPQDRESLFRSRLVLGVLVVLVGLGVVGLMWGDGEPAPDTVARASSRLDAGVASAIGGAAPSNVEARGTPRRSDVPSRAVDDSASGLRRVAGRITRGGVAVAGRGVWVGDVPGLWSALAAVPAPGGSTHYSVTDQAGEFQCEVPPGTHSLQVESIAGAWVAMAGGPSGSSMPGRPSPFSALRREVVVAHEDVWIDIALDPFRIEVRALDASGRAVPRVEITLTRRAGTGHRTAMVDGAGVALFDEVSPGTWHVQGEAPFLRTAESVTVEVGPGRVDPVATLVFEPAGELDLRFESESGDPLVLQSALGVRLRRDRDGRTIQPAFGERDASMPRRGIEYEALEPGSYTVVGVQEEPANGTAAVRCPQFVLGEPVRVEVPAGERRRLTVTVRRNPHVRVRGVLPNGRLEFRAALTVRRSVDRRQVLTRRGQTQRTFRGSHFDGYLAPGRYELEFTWPDGRAWRAPLEVGAESTRHVVQLSAR